MSVRRILLVGEGRHAWHEPAWERALSDLGYEVELFRFAPFFTGFLGRVQSRFLVGSRMGLSNRTLIQVARDFRPDIVVGYRALQLLPDTLEELRSHFPGIRLVSYQNDNIFGSLSGKSYWRLFRRTIPLYDLNLVYRESDIEGFGQLGSRRSIVLRSFYLPWLHRPLDAVDVRGASIDVGFYGHYEPDARTEQLDVLMRSVPAIYSVRGSNWKLASKGHPWAGLDTTPVHGEEYVRAINMTSLCLCFLSTWNRDTYTRRCFEIPACGSLLLSHRTADLAAMYDEDKEAVFFSSADELVDKVRFLLGHPEHRHCVATAGRLRCLSSGYDIHSRMKEWLSQL